MTNKTDSESSRETKHDPVTITAERSRPPASGQVALTTSEPRTALTPLDGDPAQFRKALERRGANRKALMGWVKESLVPGVDYGKIHVYKHCHDKYDCNNPAHFSKDALRKSGAEKICGMLGLTVTFPTLSDYEQAALNGVEIHSIVLRCHLLNANGDIVADGVGARSLAQDNGDLNKALKMAAKSAHLDASLRCGGLSEVFTQDDGSIGDAEPGAPQMDMPRDNGQSGAALTEGQQRLIYARCKAAGIELGEFCAQFGLADYIDLPRSRVNEALDWIAANASAQ